MSKKEPKKIEMTPSSVPIMDQPETALELINKYGTYNIQPTADTVNRFPAIAQGLPENGEITADRKTNKTQTGGCGHPHPTN